jgi:CheY-like chemotaxis protein/anti-sigma regulatory factor (Ser/Thr protein kinase)
MFQIQARSAQISLILENSIDTEAAVSEVDATKISQVIRNIISNALKFTPVGGFVVVSIVTKDDGKRIRIDVKDSGVGMKKADRQRLFSEVVQFNPKELQDGQGSGLGLFLSRKIVDMHGGAIGVDLDWEGQGSIFYMELLTTDKPEVNPRGTVRGHLGDCLTNLLVCVARRLSAKFHAINSSADGAPQSFEQTMADIVRPYPESGGLRLLVCDDAVLCRKFHRRILMSTRSIGEIIDASNGLEAVDIIRDAVTNGLQIHGILIDSSMPFMNGTTAVKIMREIGYIGKIFGITGNAFQSDIDDFLNHGVNEVLIKPLSMEKYAYIVQSLLESTVSLKSAAK